MTKRNQDLELKSQTDLKKETGATIMSQRKVNIRSGPMPPPEEIEQYEKISPGFARDFMDLVKDEAAHRHQSDNKRLELADKNLEIKEGQIKKDFVINLLGVISAFVLGFTVIGGGLYIAIALGHILEGIGLASSIVVGMIGAFIYGTKSINKD